MCLEIGNKVAVLDDVIKGIVMKIENNSVSVKSDDGMMYTFNRDELVKIDIEQHKLTKYSDINNSMLKEKQGVPSKKKRGFKKYKNDVVMEVDLHASKLLRSTKNMDNFDILSIQLDTAKRKLEYCIQKRIPKIVFIHGVGQGVLKTELQFLLNKYPVNYYDASYVKYGLGATEVSVNFTKTQK